uniref:PHD and ring finger domains 1 n=1 Tax=Cyprinus carpio TaxID=7962 RepID=A0A8C2FYX1_CYPCA
DRIVFNGILLRKCYGGKVQKTPVKPTEEQVEVDLDQTSCEVCGGRDREDRLLLCDGCDDGYHMECLTPPLDAVPVEEWFCPMCIAHNRSEQISEEESSSLPTTSRPPSRPTRAIARTQHSERVRANVNRRRITQARTAAQLAPRYMIQSTWLDETINAVVAGLNTAVYVRDLTPHSKSRRRRKTVKRRKTKSKSSATSAGKANMGVKRRKRKVVKKETNSRGRIARSLGIKKPKSGSMIPSVYRPSEYSLGSMRAEIGAASLSVYGDPFDLDPFDDREDEIQVPTPSSVLDVKRRGLSHSALRSHQPVARPISAGLSRYVPQVADGAEEAPVSDLLGSILSGQSMLLMDSSDVVINRDGSLKATKPGKLYFGDFSINRFRLRGSRRHTELRNKSHSTLWRGWSFLQPIEEAPTHTQFPSVLPGNNHLSTNGIRSQPLSRVPNGPSDSPHQDKEGPVRQPPVRKPPPKPVWVDVAVLPRIPKIKRDSTSSANSSSGSSSNTLPGSSVTSLAGNRDRTVDQQGTGASQQNRTVDAQRQREDRTGASSSFSSSFTSTTSSFSASSNSHPSSSSISFRINSSGNPWQVQRLPASGGTLPGGEVEAIKKKNKSKQMLLSLRAKAKEEKSEVYDPFNPTGSDSSDNEPENEGPEISIQNTAPRVQIGFNENVCHQIKSEPLDVHSDTERGLEMCAEVKTEPDCLWDRPCEESPHHSDTMHSQALDSTSCEEGMDTGSGGTPGSPFQKTEEHSRSSLSCSEINVKVEVKSEPETGTLPIRPQSKSLEESLANLQQASKENGVCKELPSVSGAFNSSNTAKHKEERPHQSQSKDRKRSPSNSQSLSSKDSHKKTHSKLKEKRRSRSRSRDRQRSRSKSKERQRSRSRSKERRRLRTRDRRCSSSSSSRERKTSGRRASHERNDNRGRERPRKRSKERRRSRSRSLSRSRERRRTLKFQGETKLKRQRSRSTSRERKRREERSEISQRTERSSYKSAEPMSTESHEPALRANKNTMPVKTEQDARPQKCETTVALPSVKQETQSVEITYMKKLHMQERAIEEVKLAIKPFYQKRDITKEEYKEILRKAVQKVCHSKSGEINPVKVANLVKAYVDMFKHAKKHKKEETVGSVSLRKLTQSIYVN